MSSGEAADGTLSTYPDIALPSAEDLLRGKPIDWIVLKTHEVLVVESVAPRPDPLARLNLKIDQLQKTYNRILKYKPAKDAEVQRQKSAAKDPGRDQEFADRLAVLKQEVEAARDRWQEARQSTKIQLTLVDDSVDPDYMLDTRHIQLVVHYEDLLLRRADQLIDEGRVPLAYDLLLVVERRHRQNNALIQAELEAAKAALQADVKAREDERDQLRTERKALVTAKKRTDEIDKSIVSCNTEIDEFKAEITEVDRQLNLPRAARGPKPQPPRKDDLLLPAWPKFDETYHKLVQKDADQHAARGDAEGALRLLEEIWRPDRDIPGLSDQLGRTVDQLIVPLVETHDYRRARHFLNRLTAHDPNHATALKWKTDLTSMASALVTEARSVASRGEAASAVELIERAARAWPETPGLREAHRELTDRYQSLKVGVLRLPGEATGHAFSSEADDRERQLTTASLFEPARIDDQGVRYRSAFFEAWEPTDLGRQVRFTLKLRRADSESRALITAADVWEEMSARLDPGRSDFDERLAGFVEGISVQSPSEFTVRFRRLPLRLENLCQMTVALSDQSLALNGDLSGETASQLGRQRFHQASRDERRIVYRRVRPQPASTRQRHIDEIVEVRYDSWDKALQGLLRGEVAALPSVDLRDVKALQDDGRFFVTPYALPKSHFLQFDPHNAALRDGQLRRALLHAIPRERLLNELVLKDVSGPRARLITGPFSTNNYGYNRLLTQPEYDPQLAAALALTAKKQLGGTLPALRLTCPPEATAREAARTMIEHWKRVGIEVRLLDDEGPIAPGAADGGWDICYRIARLVEPIADIWPLLTLQTEARVDALQSLPERSRRMLLELERTVDWTTAARLLHRLLADLLTEARYVPLWEVDEFFVMRRHLVGLQARPMHAYDDVERWTLQSWYPQETP